MDTTKLDLVSTYYVNLCCLKLEKSIYSYIITLANDVPDNHTIATSQLI